MMDLGGDVLQSILQEKYYRLKKVTVSHKSTNHNMDQRSAGYYREGQGVIVRSVNTSGCQSFTPCTMPKNRLYQICNINNKLKPITHIWFNPEPDLVLNQSYTKDWLLLRYTSLVFKKKLKKTLQLVLKKTIRS